MRTWGVWLAVAVIVALALSGCTGPAAQSDEQPEQASVQESAPKATIRFADTQFQTIWLNNAIAKFIVEHGYGYPVESIEVSTPIAQQSLQDGELDVWMELWRINIMDWYNEVTASGEVIDLGETFEKSTQGFYVPRYVIEGDAERGIEPMAPDLKSVFDLPEYTDLFQDPEDPDKGMLVNCITGWQCAKINRIKLNAYGLSDEYNTLEPGAAAALDAAIAGAYKKGEPVLAYYWEPTWLLGTYDMVQLEEPEWTPECDAEIQRALTGEIEEDAVTEAAGCAYQTVGIHKGVASAMEDKAPELVSFLSRRL